MTLVGAILLAVIGLILMLMTVGVLHLIGIVLFVVGVVAALLIAVSGYPRA
jgi:hypothetical protein